MNHTATASTLLADGLLGLLALCVLGAALAGLLGWLESPQRHRRRTARIIRRSVRRVLQARAELGDDAVPYPG